MMNDKFNEMYLKLVQAKGYEKKSNNHAALKLYLEVCESYLPNDDFAFKRASLLLQKQGEYSDAKRIAKLAIKKIKEEEITGNLSYYIDFIKSMEEKIEPVKNEKKNIESLKIVNNKVSLIILIMSLLFFILISLPDKFFKLMFLSFGVLALLFLFAIIQDLKKHLNIRTKSIIFVICLCSSLFGVYKMPQSDWELFISIPSINEMQKSDSFISNKNYKNNKESNLKDNKVKIKSEDLDKLKEFAKNEIGLKSYKIKILEDTVALELTMKEGSKLEEGKKIALNILNNLSLIKGASSNANDELGSLFLQYNVDVKIHESIGIKSIAGYAKKGIKSIKWKN